MSVEKIESMEWHYLDDDAGDGLIEIELRDLFEPYLLHTSYCSRITIWWDSDTHEYEESIKLYAIEEPENLDREKPFINKVESWYDADELMEAIKYVQANLT